MICLVETRPIYQGHEALSGAYLASRVDISLDHIYKDQLEDQTATESTEVLASGSASLVPSGEGSSVEECA